MTPGNFLFSTLAFALFLSFSPYASAASDQALPEKSNWVDMILDLPALPARALGNKSEKILEDLLQTGFPQRFSSFWEEGLHGNGIYPQMRYSPGNLGIGGGADVALEELIRSKKILPFLESNITGGGTLDGDYDLGGDLQLAKKWGPLFYLNGNYTYNHRENESFSGLGPRSSLGDKVRYIENIHLVRGRLGFFPSRTVTAGIETSYRHIHIGNTAKKNTANLSDLYTLNELPGRNGGEILTAGVYLVHDSRDIEDSPTQGGLHRFTVYFNRDVVHNDDYFKYALDLAHYFRLGSEKRAFSINFHGERAQDIRHSSIPFFDLPHLGNFGEYESATHRGYIYNRFFDQSSAVLSLGYRRQIWQYRDLTADWLYFADTGKVFEKLSAFGKGGMKVSYGAGLQLKIKHDLFFTSEFAVSDEGTLFYVCTKTPF